MTLEDYADDEVEVWPENWDAFGVFAALQTQWRVGGMGGPTGLDYNVLYHKLDRMNLAPDKYEQMESDISVMESEALKSMKQ